MFRLGTIHILRKHWTGWVGSEIGHFCLLTVHREWVGQKIPQNTLTWYLNGPLLIFDRTQDPCPTSAISAAMKNCYLICTLVKNFVEMRNSGLEILETMTVDRRLQIGFKCFIYFSVLQNVATTYPGKTHTRKTVQMRSMRICSCYKIWSKTACCKLASKRRGNASFLTNFLLFLQRVCNSSNFLLILLSRDQKFFSFDDFTWSKELSDQWTFLKQNFCHKKPKVARH